jgi:hypothetical protein
MTRPDGPQFTIYVEQIFSDEQLEKQAQIDELERHNLHNNLELYEQQAVFDAREEAYNRRLMEHGEKAAQEWLESEKKKNA